MKTAPRLLCALLAVAVLTLSACSSGSGKNFHFKSATPIGQLYPASDRKPAGSFDGTLLTGQKFDLASTRGKVVVLTFWASWCAPCQVETPQFDLLYRQIKSQGVDFVGVNTKDIKSKADAFVSSNDISFPSVFDPDGQTELELGDIPQSALPNTILLDKQGNIAAVYLARLSAKDLQGPIDSLLAGH
ncbi:MAG: TlpA family protein disulfide reductase [Actinobacteria bacterium]|nr:TlpA family protein disulfide reductase [Actinomycetota bacterium]